jgi:hypothetical protein
MHPVVPMATEACTGPLVVLLQGPPADADEDFNNRQNRRADLRPRDAAVGHRTCAGAAGKLHEHHSLDPAKTALIVALEANAAARVAAL